MSALGDLGSLPSVTLGPSLALGVTWGAWRVEVGGAYLLSQRATLSSNRGGDFDLLVGSVAGCGAVRVARAQLGGCVGAELGRIQGLGFGVSDPGSGDDLWLAVNAVGRASFALTPRWVLVGEIGAGVPLRRPRFVLDGVGAVFQASGAVGRASLGVEVRF